MRLGRPPPRGRRRGPASRCPCVCGRCRAPSCQDGPERGGRRQALPGLVPRYSVREAVTWVRSSAGDGSGASPSRAGEKGPGGSGAGALTVPALRRELWARCCCSCSGTSRGSGRCRTPRQNEGFPGVPRCPPSPQVSGYGPGRAAGGCRVGFLMRLEESWERLTAALGPWGECRENLCFLTIWFSPILCVLTFVFCSGFCCTNFPLLIVCVVRGHSVHAQTGVVALSRHSLCALYYSGDRSLNQLSW